MVGRLGRDEPHPAQLEELEQGTDFNRLPTTSLSVPGVGGALYVCAHSLPT